jgi:hypothetical protein
MQNSGKRVVSNVARGLFALGYLIGSLVHIRFALTNNHTYEAFGKTALIPRFPELRTSVVKPNITFFALLLAAFEITTSIIILSRGKYVKLSGQCVVRLVPRAIGSRLAASRLESRLFVNRLPNLLFTLPQLPLFWVQFDKSFPEFLRARLR